MGKSHGRALRVSNSGNQPVLDHHEEAGMPAKRELTMRQLRYMLRLHHDGVSAREIGRTLGVARSTIRDNLRRAQASGIDWPVPAGQIPSAEDRLPKSLHFAEFDVIIGVVRARSVHEVGYGHKWDWESVTGRGRRR